MNPPKPAKVLPLGLLDAPLPVGPGVLVGFLFGELVADADRKETRTL